MVKRNLDDWVAMEGEGPEARDSTSRGAGRGGDSMKIRKIECNNQKKTFEVTTFSGRSVFLSVRKGVSEP